MRARHRTADDGGAKGVMESLAGIPLGSEGWVGTVQGALRSTLG